MESKSEEDKTQGEAGRLHGGIPSAESKATCELSAAPSFTPAPWELDPNTYRHDDGYSYFEIAAVDSAEWLAHVQTFSDSSREANARLIAAAPALYAACVTAQHLLVLIYSEGSEIDQLTAALALADGQVTNTDASSGTTE